MISVRKSLTHSTLASHCEKLRNLPEQTPHTVVRVIQFLPACWEKIFTVRLVLCFKLSLNESTKTTRQQEEEKNMTFIQYLISHWTYSYSEWRVINFSPFGLLKDGSWASLQTCQPDSNCITALCSVVLCVLHNGRATWWCMRVNALNSYSIHQQIFSLISLSHKICNTPTHCFPMRNGINFLAIISRPIRTSVHFLVVL